jgi:hypothetical protein
MQPYFFPYIGYFQLINLVDVFVVYDNIKYTKKGWINRNRLLQNGKDVMFTLHLKNDSNSLDVCERELAPNFNRNKLLNQIKGAYHRAPYFEQAFPLIECIVQYEDNNLFRFLHNSIIATCKHLDIDTEIRVSSAIAIDHSCKNQVKVLALCEALGASTYVNAIGGMELYSMTPFFDRGIELKFIKSKPFEYAQFTNDFVPSLSIIDVMMFNSETMVKECLDNNFEMI